MLSFNLNTAQLSRQLGRSPQLIAAASESALDRCAQIALNAKGRMVNRTYARAIPRGRSGRPKWRRSGAWQRGQAITSSRGRRTIEATGPAAAYEARLATLPTGRDGISRRNPATADAARIVEPQLRAVFEREIRNVLGL
ncbi:MAG TPA: hypothetical protein VNM48_09030 [Chloroflexota bacterium]|nr:hypothetical protein [Chloroflexota bacterium]